MKDIISFDEFSKIDVAVGRIEAVAVVEGADKLLALTVEVGEETPRQIVSGIRKYFSDPQELVGKLCPFVLNLEPRTIRGVESQGMIFAADHEAQFVLFEPSAAVPPGTRLS